MQPQWRNAFLLRLAAILVGITVSVLALEIVLRFFPVHEGTHNLPVNQQQPVMRFEPHRKFVWSKGWNFALANHVRTNNFGFVNAKDYDPKATTPLLAVIGDSYVEAIMVPSGETFAGRLAERFKDSARVYTLGVSGAPLSQYLVYAEYARKTFQAGGMIVVVVGNDFDESLMKFAALPGFHQFVEQSNGRLVLKRVDFSVSIAKKIARKSALLRYLLANLEVQALPQRLRTFAAKDEAYALYAGNTYVHADSARLADSKRAVEAFFDELPGRSGLGPSQILFVVDGIRRQLYDEAQLERARGSYFDLMRRYFMASTEARGYEIIDLQPIFIEHYQKHGRQFEHPTDLHWNALGHQVVFEAILQSRYLAGFANRAAVGSIPPTCFAQKKENTLR